MYLIVYMYETLKQKFRCCLLWIAEEQEWKTGTMIRTDIALRGGVGGEMAYGLPSGQRTTKKMGPYTALKNKAQQNPKPTN